ncbi:MAG: phenylacetate--CoA ligase family protein [Burkholderiales bacterium]|nr:MAG: phenylacetate--CoA ligase family protein [Burkholderiales bacterium]
MSTVFDAWQFAQVSAEVSLAGHGRGGEIARLQRLRVAQVLHAAAEGAAVYRERLRRVPEEMDPLQALSRMEPVGRRELMSRFSEWVTDPALSLADLRAHTADPGRIGEPFLGRYLVWESSGTSGSPGIFVQDARCMAVYDALESQRRSQAQVLRRWMDPLCLSERIAFVGATGGHFASFVSVERLRRLQPWLAGSVRSFSILQPLDDLVAQLNEFGPSVLASYPTAAALLGQEAQAGRLDVRLREIWTGGETLTGAMRRHLLRSFPDASVRNSYGASEFLAMAWECEHGHLHLNSDWVILEAVDEHHRPVPPGHPSATVLLTHLANTAQPLIRYDLGDHVRLLAEPCTCGSPLPVVEVQGRRDDTLQVAGQRGHLVALLPLALSTVLEEEAGLFDFQVCQKDDHTLLLRLPQSGQEGRQALARGRRVLKDFARSQGSVALRVQGELGCLVPRGRSGKSCRILPGGGGR